VRVSDRHPTIPGRAAVGLRLAGASYGEIAEVLGYSTAVQAREAIEQDLALEASEEGRDQLRDMEGERILKLLKPVWVKATNARDPEHLAAVKVALALIDRRIRLFGLDAPQEVIVYNPSAAEIDEWVAKMIETPQFEVLEGEVVSDVG